MRFLWVVRQLFWHVVTRFSFTGALAPSVPSLLSWAYLFLSLEMSVPSYYPVSSKAASLETYRAQQSYLGDSERSYHYQIGPPFLGKGLVQLGSSARSLGGLVKCRILVNGLLWRTRGRGNRKDC